MVSRLHSLWLYMMDHRLLTTVIIIALTAFALLVWIFGWDWTGFNGGYSQITTTSVNQGTTTATVRPPGRTLWDVLQLLIVPVMLAIGGFWLNQIQKSRDEKAAEQRAEVERIAAERRAKTEHEIADDNRCETLLQAYIDKMSELLFEKSLRKSSPEDDVRKIARVRTLTILPRLDSNRKCILLQFLLGSGLIQKDDPVIDLDQADLHGINLGVVDLTEANLSGADLHEAILQGTNLEKANLSSVNLSNADLSGANLKDATGIAVEELERQAKSLKGATMPDGSIHP